MLPIARKLGKVVGWFVAGLVGIVALGALLVQLRPVRLAIRDRVVEAVRGSVRGELEIDDLRWPRFDRLELTGLRVNDREGNRALDVSGVYLNIRLAALFSGEVEVSSVEVEHPYAFFAPQNAHAGLLSVLESPEEPPQPSTKSALSPVPITLERVCVTNGRVELALESRTFTVRSLDVCARMRIDDAFEAALQRISGEVWSGKHELLALRPDAGAIETSCDGVARGAVKGRLRVGGTSELAFDAHLGLRGFCSESLRALGVDADLLERAVAADVHATQAAGTLRARATFHGAGSALRLTAAIDPSGVLDAQLSTDGLALARLSSLDLQPLAFQLHARAELARPVKTVSMRIPYALYGSLPLPRITGSAEFHPNGAIVLSQLSLREGAARVQAHGRLESGAVHAEVGLDVPRLAELPPVERTLPLRGSLEGELRFDRSAAGELAIEGRVNVADAAFEANRVERLQLRFSADGPIEAPRVGARLSAQGLALGDQYVGRVRAQLKGGPEEYRVRVQAPQTHGLELDAAATRSDQAWSGHLRAAAALGPGRISVRAAGVKLVPTEFVHVGLLRASYLGAALRGWAHLSLGGERSRAKIEVHADDVTRITRALAGRALHGQVHARARLHGTLAEPYVAVDAQLRNGPRLAGARARADLKLEADLARGRGNLQLEAAAGAASADVNLASRWRRNRPLSVAFARGHHELHASVSDISFGALSAVEPRTQFFRGTLSSDLEARGDLHELSFVNHVRAQVSEADRSSPVDLRVDVDYAHEKLGVQARASDVRGRLASLQASLSAGIEHWIETPPDLIAIAERPWEIALDVNPRRLHEYPGARALLREPGFGAATLSAHARLQHAPGAEPTGSVRTSVAWKPLARSESGCAAARSPQLTAKATLRDGGLQLALSGRSAGRPILDAETALPLRFSEWIRGSTPLLPSHFTATLREVELSGLPILCDHAHGVVSGSVRAAQLFTPRAQVDARLDGTGLRWDDSAALSAQVTAHLERDGLAVRGDLRPGTGSARVIARLPIYLTDPSITLDRAGEVAARAQLVRVDVSALLGFVPGVARASGTVGGNLQVGGTFSKPIARGRLELSDVSLTLPKAGQRLSHIHAIARLEGRTLTLSETRVHDRNGSARISATLHFDSFSAWRADVDVRAQNFPIRPSGVLIGRVDTVAHAQFQTTRDRLAIDLSLKDTTVALTGNTGADVQSLEPNPDIVFASELGRKREADGARQAGDAGLALVLHIQSEPMWVRRDDFAVLMDADMTIDLTGTDGPALRGQIQLQRGYINLLGESFDINRGRVVFTGGQTIDPQLDIEAEQSAAGTDVRVVVSGFVHEPQLAFFVNDEPVTAGEAVSALAGGHGTNASGATAEQQLASAAVGMTTGLLSLAARREFGDWIPMFSIEQGAQTRVRIGFDADRLIPDFLDEFVRGAYVEGIVSTDGNSQPVRPGAGGTTEAGSAVLLELTLPSDLVWAGQYGPGNMWSVDLDWRP
jgi:autotransporter translocation and assembly factor TamB